MQSAEIKKTALYSAHLAAGARMVDFSGWEMPINYGSQLDEHHVVRKDAGMFDVSHMTVVDVRGAGTRSFLQHLLANDVARLAEPGKALYSCMLNERGGVIDDLITYFLDDNYFRLVVNAATRSKDLAWMQEQARGFDVQVAEQHDLAMIAVQGPNARAKTLSVLPAADAVVAEGLQALFAAQCGEFFIARTGYTGEDGFEISLPADRATGFWEQLLSAGVKPCGLGARDSLRLEAGMNLYGQDMDENTSPLESGLAWTVAMKDGRDFIGRAALETQIAGGIHMRLVGLVLEDRGVLRAGQPVRTSRGSGLTTSGGFSPSLNRTIAFARIPAGDDLECAVDIRGKPLRARIVRPPFVRHGKPCAGVL
ncbi:MAG: glycine cleavage system aminomethyltransferase GcvT [Xanthomonadales bacterium]|nr:glycine cleavage system aminomethyltransferase GcvT [Xanthomonadales bacterium]